MHRHPGTGEVSYELSSTDPWITYGRTRENTFVTVSNPQAESYAAISAGGEIVGRAASGSRAFDRHAIGLPRGGLPFGGEVGLGPYTAVVLSQDE